jgi:hypothetical protein
MGTSWLARAVKAPVSWFGKANESLALTGLRCIVRARAENDWHASTRW